MNDLDIRVEKLSPSAQSYFNQLVSDGGERPNDQMIKIRDGLSKGTIGPDQQGAAHLALVALTGAGRPDDEQSGQLTDDEARASYEAAIVKATAEGNEAQAAHLQGILDRNADKKQAAIERVYKVVSDKAIDDMRELEQRTADFDEKYKAMRQVEIDRLTGSRMTLENAEKFFEEHTAPNLERSLRASYSLPA
jgi:hypothetical protein